MSNENTPDGGAVAAEAGATMAAKFQCVTPECMNRATIGRQCAECFDDPEKDCPHTKDGKSTIEPYGDMNHACCTLCGDDTFPITEEAAYGKEDLIDDPAHYGGKDNPYEAIKVMLAWHDADVVAAFCHMTAIKYLARAGKKREEGESVQLAMIRDLRKAAWYSKAAADIMTHGQVRK